MKKKIFLGNIDFNETGRKENRATLSIELKETPKGEEFSASGEIWNLRNTDIICGGQCLDEMKPFFKNNLLFNKIYKFWKLYHLNGMHPECEHQHAQKWHEQATEEIKFFIFKKNIDAITQSNETEKNILKRLKNGETVKPTKKEIFFLNLKYEIKTTKKELSKKLAPFYRLEKEETQARGWTDYKENKKGLLCKPCSVCGYKYGTAWKFFPIPKKDLEEIKKLFLED